MENSLLAIFDKIWLETMYYSTWSRAKFLSNLKKIVRNPILIGINSNLIYIIRTCICIRKNYKNGEFSPSQFCQNLTRDHVL